MGSKRPNLKPPSSSSDEEEASAGEDSSSEEEQQPASLPPTKKPSSKSTPSKTQPSSKSPQKPTVADNDNDDDDDDDDDDDEEDESDDSTVARKKDLKEKEDKEDNDDDDDDDEEDESDDSTVARKKDLKEKEDKEVEASSEEEEEAAAKLQPLKKPDSSARSGSGSGSDSGSGSYSDSDSKPSEKQAVAKVEPAAESGRKRQIILSPSEAGNNQKKQKLFQRFWEQEDETKIVEAIISFYSNKGSEPPFNAVSGADLDGILDLLKKSVTSEFTKGQLSTKIRNLRRKFQNNASREKNKPGGLKFSKPHDQEMYELSKKIWQPTKPLGDGIGGVKSVKRKGKSSTLDSEKEQEDGNDSEVDADYEYLAKAIGWARPLNMAYLSINKGLKLIDPAKARSLEKRLRSLESMRFEHRMKWMDKLEEASQIIKDAVEKSG